MKKYLFAAVLLSLASNPLPASCAASTEQSVDLFASAPLLFWNDSQSRLEGLLRESLRPGADKKAVYERIWNIFGEDWAVMFTDFSGFTRTDLELGTPQSLALIYASQMLQFGQVEKHDGIVARIRADGLMILFRKPEQAVNCAVAIQRAIKSYNSGIKNPKEHLRIYVGIGYGRVLNIGNKEVYGAEVNAAANLQGEAKAGGIMVTKAVKEKVQALGEGVAFGPRQDFEGGSYRVNY